MKDNTNDLKFYKELIGIMDQIDSLAKELKKPEIPSSVEIGFESSKIGSKQPMEVPMSPWCKNVLRKFKDFPNDRRLGVDDKPTQGESWMYDACKKINAKYFPGPEKYDESLPLRDFAHYCTQVNQQLHENMRQVIPGQADEREEAIKEYTRATKPIGIRQRLLKDKIFQKAVKLVFDEMPYVKATNEWREVNTPFMNKHSNVGNEWWKRDNTLVPGSTETYGEMTLRIAKDVPLKDLWKWNLSTMYGRNQRKGRLIIAVPRIINLSLNRLQSPEIETYKNKSSLFVGYQDDVALQYTLTNILLHCEQQGYKCRNVDQSRFDRHISYDMLLLENAMRIMKVQDTSDHLGKDIALMRAVLCTKTWCIDGLAHTIRELQGRIFSGEIDTNLMGGIISAIINTWGNLVCDPTYSIIPHTLRYWMLVMGDDCLSVYKDRDERQFDDFMASINYKTNAEKDEYGPMFLQERVFEDPDSHELVMAYAYDRVYEHLMFKETPKGLGPAGWYISFLMSVQKVCQCTRALKSIVNLVLPFDDYKLFIDKDISYVISLMEQEDRDRMAKAKTGNQKSRAESSVNILYDGDPTKDRFMKSIDKAKSNSGLLHTLHEAVKKSVDPNWLSDAGITIPTK